MPQKKTQEQFITDARKVHGDKYDYSKVRYVSARNKVNIICPVHGDFWTLPSNHLRGTGCPRCTFGNYKLTTEEFKKIAASAAPHIEVIGEYHLTKTPVSVRCRTCGYEWDTLPDNLLKGRGCPRCAHHIKKTQESFVQELASINPHIEVIGAYRSVNDRIEVKCKVCGHEWSPIADSILRGTGCPKCADAVRSENYRLGLEEVQKRVSLQHPEIEVSGVYINKRSKLTCKCTVCDCTWTTTTDSLLQGCGCPKCAGNYRKSHVEFVEQLKSISPSIQVLSEYVDSKTYIDVRCSVCGHEWHTSPSNMLSGRSCPVCSKKRRAIEQTLTQEEVVLKVHKYNPDIQIIGEYKGSRYRIEVRCENCGHQWNPCASNLIAGVGCPKCAKTSTSFVEQFIFASLSLCIGEAEVISRDKQAIGAELDIYIPKFKLAIEYGSWFWHKEKLAKDFEKRTKCQDSGISLITIYDSCHGECNLHVDDVIIFDEDISKEKNKNDLLRLISQILDRVGVNTSLSAEELYQIGFSASRSSRKVTTEEFKSKLKMINPDVEVLGFYNGVDSKVSCICKKCGYDWEATPWHLYEGKGCPRCAGTLHKTRSSFIEELEGVQPNIKVLGEYKNNRTPIEAECRKCGYRWTPTPGNLLRGHGCPSCAHHNPRPRKKTK